MFQTEFMFASEREQRTLAISDLLNPFLGVELIELGLSPYEDQSNFDL